MDSLAEIFKTHKREELKYTANYEFQARVLEVIGEFKIKPKMHGMIFKAFRRNRSKAEAAYQNAKGKKSPAGYFIWLLTH